MSPFAELRVFPLQPVILILDLKYGFPLPGIGTGGFSVWAIPDLSGVFPEAPF
jgi:hypothetical protein